MASLALGRYIPFNSFIHRLDPRVKLLAMVALMTSIFLRFSSVWMNLTMYAVLFLLIVSLMHIAHIRLSSMFKQLKALWVMMVFLLIINLLVPNTSEITTYFMVGPIRIYVSALLQTFYIVFRLILMLGLTLMLTGTTRPLDLTYAIEWYLTPFKIVRFPTHEVAMTIAIALRFIPTLLEETMRIMKAQASRGVDFVNGKLREKLRAIIALIVPLFISAFQRSEELANAMEARGYDPSAPRTRYRQLKWNTRDTWAFLVIVLVLTGMITLNVLHVDIAEVWHAL
jgi:energy-coupling factor transport system permease protein